MKIVEPSVELINPPSYETMLATIEAAGRTCYKSEDKITDTSAAKFVTSIINRGHESVLEHGSVTVRFICDRGVSHEIVRHRMASYCQESTRYCSYAADKFGNEISVIAPATFERDSAPYRIWERQCKQAETAYFDLMAEGCKPQEARSILPTCLKTELVMTANMREWRHFIRLRTDPAAHPDMRVAATMLYQLMLDRYPVFFRDLQVGGTK